MSYAEIYQPKNQTYASLYNGALILTASALLAISAQLSIQLPFSPVPITGQTLAVLLLAAALGKRRGLAAVTLYLAEGAAGLPVFAGGKAGWAVLLGPTGGYLMGFAAAAYLVGDLIQRGWDRNLWRAVSAMMLGNMVIYLAGLAWLSFFIQGSQLLALGLTPFLVGDALKISLAAVLLAASGMIKSARKAKN